MKEFDLSSKRKEIIEVIKDLEADKLSTILIHKILKLIQIQDKEFIRLLKERFNNIGYNEKYCPLLYGEIDKLAGKDLYE